MSINSISTDQKALLEAMQGMKDGTASFDTTAKIDGKFSDYLANALNTVNDLQGESDALKKSFALGEDISLGELMIKSQKTTVAFNALVQVRNKLIGAYKEIMNMPV